MLYDGVLTYDYRVIVSETDCYADTARHVVVMKAEDALGLISSNSVIVIYDITDYLPIIISERCDVNEISIDDVKRRVENFNAANENYIAVIGESNEWIDVTVTRRKVYDTIESSL